jgi:adenylate cyclase
MSTPKPWWKGLLGNQVREGSAGRRQRRNSVGLIATLAAATVTALSQTAPWQLVEARAYDYLSTTLPPARPADGPVIVAIDEPSLAELRLQWPWPRDLHARLVTALRQAGARTIGLDIIFAEPSNTAADEALAAAMGPDVVLAADESLIETPQANQVVRAEPLPELTASGARSGIASIMLDHDGALRRVPRYPDGFSTVMMQMAGGPATNVPAGALMQSFGPARSYPTVSYYQALDPDNFLPPDTFRGRTVIVGLSMQSAPAVDAGGADTYATSWTARTGRLVSGAEVQATIYDNLAAKLFVRPAPTAAGIAATALAVLLAGLAVWRRTGWRTIAAAVFAIVAFGAGSFVLLRFGRIYLPPLSPSLAFVAVAAAQGARDYAAERRLRQNITRAFSQYLSPVLVERLARDPSKLKLGGEKRKLTILFCDVRGFTTISERMKDDPERLTLLINRLLNPLSDVVMKAGGTIDKYIGDCIMAFWNAPLDNLEHAPHAVGAALEMIRALDPLNAELAAEAAEKGEAPLELRIGIGINTGDCVVGNMGSDRRFDYSVLGDAVNLASRLEGQTKNYDVPLLLGSETARLAAGHFTVVELDRTLVKGKSEVATVSTVVSPVSETVLAEHRALLCDIYAGRTAKALARLDHLTEQLPALAGYYAGIRHRLAASTPYVGG